MNLTHTGHVDEQPAAGHNKQFTVRGRVSTTMIIRAHGVGALSFLAQQSVYYCGLSHFGRADERTGFTLTQLG